MGDIPDISLRIEKMSAFVGVMERAINLNKNKRQTRFHLYVSPEGQLRTTEHKSIITKKMGSYIGVFWFDRKNHNVYFKSPLFYHMEVDISRIMTARDFLPVFIYKS